MMTGAAAEMQIRSRQVIAVSRNVNASTTIRTRDGGFGLMLRGRADAQNAAIGLTGDPVPLGIGSGAIVSMNSQR